MMLPAIDFAHMNAFFSVVDTGSFAAAGRRLGISGSAVGQSIKQFEKSLGIQLFLRTTRKVVLTERGATLLQRLFPAAEALADAVNHARSSAPRPQGRIRVHSPRFAVEDFLLSVLAVFASEYPEIEIDLTVSDNDVDVLKDGFDIALKIGETVDLDMVAMRLGGDLRQLALAAPSFIEKHGRPAHPRNLVDFPCLRWRWPGKETSYDWEFAEDGRWFSIKVCGPLVLSDRPLILRLALRGVGICLLGEGDARPYLESGALINLLDEWSAPFPGWHLCYPKQKYLPQSTRLFIDAVRKAAKGGQ
jgi:DNA-binding transcriptional LysR family regulator